MFETDKQGEFEIRGLPWGRYVVLAGKEEDGYPDTKSAFYSNLSVPRVLIGPNLPVPYVTVKLGPKAGLLEIKSVMNADTGAVLSSASLTVRRAENEFFLITSAVTDRVVQIPPGIDVFVGVSAPGYKLWTPLNSDGKPEKLRLKPGEIRRLAVQLQPEAR